MTDAERPIVNIEGELVALGPLRRDLLPVYERWGNDWEVSVGFGGPFLPAARERTEEYYERARVTTGDSIEFTIWERATWRPIGATKLHNISREHQRARFAISIGEKDAWGKGYGTEVARLMLDYAFTALGLHHVGLEVYQFNERGRRAYLRAGYRECGREREAVRVGGRFWDVIYMECLASEFESPVLASIFPPPEG